MTTEAGIQDCKFKGPSSPLWIPASVGFRSVFSFIFLSKMKKIGNGGIEKSKTWPRKPESSIVSLKNRHPLSGFRLPLALFIFSFIFLSKMMKIENGGIEKSKTWPRKPESRIVSLKNRHPLCGFRLPLASVRFFISFSFQKWRKLKMAESKNLKHDHGSRNPAL